MSLDFLYYLLFATTKPPPVEETTPIPDDKPPEPVNQPNIILIVADDVGWNDVGWNNDYMKTPHLNRLAYDGLILNSSYVQSVCSPSRAALLTGYYPFRLGLQHGVIKKNKPHGLPLNSTLLPETLRGLGYSTHIIGKWHLGFCNWNYTPTFRGFDTFFGFYTGAADYYKHKAMGPERGYDFRYNTRVYRPRQLSYSTAMFGRHAVDLISHHSKKKPFFLYLPFQAAHTPLQAPKKFEKHYSHVKNPERKTFSAMVTAMDKEVGDIVAVLKRRKIDNNTVIIFLSDNGATPYFGGNNWPLRGGKSTMWEGGTRVPSFVWGQGLMHGAVSNEMIHIVDWFPTIVSMAGGKPSNQTSRRMDGVDQTGMLKHGTKSSRTEFIYGINQLNGKSAIRMGKYKLIDGNPGHYRDWYPPVDNYKKIKIRKNYNRYSDRNISSVYLFNLDRDPIESYNLATRNPALVKRMRSRLQQYKTQFAVPAFNPRKLKKAHPKFWGGVWSPGWC